MSTKKEKIIKQLEYLQEFANINKYLIINESWKSQLKQIVITYIDKDSPFLSEIDNLKFNVSSVGQPSPEYFTKQYKQSKNNAHILIFHILKYIDDNGLKRQGNFISRLSEGWSIIIFGLVLTTWSGFCIRGAVWSTQNKIDSEKIELKSKIDSLSKALSTATTVTTPIVTPDSATNLQKYQNKQRTDKHYGIKDNIP